MTTFFHIFLDGCGYELCVVDEPIAVDVLVAQDRVHQESQLRVLKKKLCESYIIKWQVSRVP